MTQLIFKLGCWNLDHVIIKGMAYGKGDITTDTVVICFPTLSILWSSTNAESKMLIYNLIQMSALNNCHFQPR